ncbi:hypothetical protein CJF42_04140 [Pseudoalteromonas sp. NBT06-2]|uniref:tetratricopeptide repeat protein n=1 Tax=Pseudoalteromonas sp. NBT06-2 TaxID=2025950 RepID=UPI000BA61301|nr:tetratricopeptide repeat protein [Pseudoalteromonas sp. NBT06-2]PAJ75687.1 hypothetical protein CJF42_04140 [Pseudoalteromonas sp. NBT06-2]
MIKFILYSLFIFFLVNAKQVKADCQSEFLDKNYIEAFALCEDESESSSQAQFYMAKIYAKGLGVNRDLNKAINYLSQAAQGEHSEAMFNLAMAFELGKGVDKNITAAYEWHLRAANKGWLKAQRKVAMMYENGQGVQPDPEKAYIWYQKAAKQGDSDSQLELGAILLQGITLPGKIVSKNIEKGLYWIRESAKQDNSEAQFALASLIVDEQPDEGISFYKKAAKNGNKFSMHNLASIYLKGDIVHKDLKQSKYYAQMAVSAGQKSSQNILEYIEKIENLNLSKRVVMQDKTNFGMSNDSLILDAEETNRTESDLETNSQIGFEKKFIQLLKNTHYIIQLASMKKQTSAHNFFIKYNLKNKAHILYIPNTKRYLVLSEPQAYLTQARELQQYYSDLIQSRSWLRKTSAILALVR